MKSEATIQKPQHRIGEWARGEIERLDRIRSGLTLLPSQIPDLEMEGVCTEILRESMRTRLMEAEQFLEHLETNLRIDQDRERRWNEKQHPTGHDCEWCRERARKQSQGQ